MVPYIRVLMSTPTFARRVRLLLAPFAVMAGVGACGSNDAAPPGAPPEALLDGGPTSKLPDGGFMRPIGSTCTLGAMQACKVLLPAHGSIHPCFVGVQICSNGTWGPCTDPPEAGARADGSTAK